MIKGRRWVLSFVLSLGMALMPLSVFAEGEQPAAAGEAPALHTTTAADAITQLI
jgi:hypothetical protein